MIRKVLAALAVVIEFAAMGGFIIPELALPSRSAFTQFFVMGSYVLLLKWTWCAVAGRKKHPEKVGTGSDAIEKRKEQAAARSFKFVEFMRRHSSVLLIIIGIFAALFIAANRYRLLSAGGSVYRIDRFSGRCEKIVSGMGSAYFVPVREQGEKISEDKSDACGSSKKVSGGFNLSKWLEDNK